MKDVITPVMLQYKTIKEQHPNCLLFFRLGDFYELFFEDAKIASKQLDIVLTCRGSNQEIPMCGVPAHASDNYIARLIKKGFHVAVCEQTEKPQAKKLINREVVRIITPGTLTEDNLLEARAHNFLMAVFPHENQLGIAWVDISTGAFCVESHAIQALLTILTRLQPQEILIPETFVQNDVLMAQWPEWKNKITPLPLSRFDRGEVKLENFFKVQTISSFGNFSFAEISAAGGLLDYVLITQKRHVLMLSRPKKMESDTFLEIDAFTRRNLEILQTFSGEKKGSLLNAIDHTVTPMGARLLFMRTTHPLKKHHLIQERLDSVQFFVQHANERRAIREIFSIFSDIERAFSRLVMDRGVPRDMGAIKNVLMALPAVASLLSHYHLPKELESLFSFLHGNKKIADILKKALVEELPVSLREGGVFAANYHEKLDEMRLYRDQSKILLENLQKKYAQETQITNLRIRYNQVVGYYIEVSPAAVSKVPFHFILKQSLISGSRYTTAELMEIEQKILSAQEDSLKLEQQLFQGLIEELKREAENFQRTIAAIAVYDVSSALAELAAIRSYVRPSLDDSKVFSVQGGRHPVVEQYVAHSFVKNTCLLTVDSPIWIITGPNMAGKSTFLRQNALISLMAHMGSFVSAESAHIGVIDRIFSRVGASDDLARGHSTFMVEMIETATILNQATEKSFVIFDEVGRGTATYDGLSLAWACLEYLAQSLQCRTLFATHYHELSALQDMPSIGFYTFKIAEWEKTIVFLHEIVKGIANRSYGLHVARLAGIPEAILHRAEAILCHLEQKNCYDDIGSVGILFKP
jgi:DNA mismatch repair protein MutS